MRMQFKVGLIFHGVKCTLTILKPVIKLRIGVASLAMDLTQITAQAVIDEYGAIFLVDIDHFVFRCMRIYEVYSPSTLNCMRTCLFCCFCNFDNQVAKFGVYYWCILVGDSPRYPQTRSSVFCSICRVINKRIANETFTDLIWRLVPDTYPKLTTIGR